MSGSLRVILFLAFAICAFALGLLLGQLLQDHIWPPGSAERVERAQRVLSLVAEEQEKLRAEEGEYTSLVSELALGNKELDKLLREGVRVNLRVGVDGYEAFSDVLLRHQVLMIPEKASRYRVSVLEGEIAYTCSGHCEKREWR